MCRATEFGKARAQWDSEWAVGAGPPHTDAKLRLFGAKEEDVRVTYYRDASAWCPYCKSERFQCTVSLSKLYDCKLLST
jgi:hypothetical protein